MSASVLIPIVVSGVVGILGVAGLVLNGALDRRRARDADARAELRAAESERRAAEAEQIRIRLEELNKDRDFLADRVKVLFEELEAAKAAEARERSRADQLDERLGAARKDLQIASREIERLKARLEEL